jgi:D-glycero-alpha-D-manno-heptose-7-phosphate kinase
LMLFFTGFSRIASTMAKKQIDNIENREHELKTMAGYVDQAIEILQSDRAIGEMGGLLHDNWMLKRQLAGGVSTPEIDAIYEAAREAGAIGGKLLGAGGGGFMILFAAPKNHAAIERRLGNLVRVKFDFDYTGSKIVVYEPAGLESR